MAAEFSCWLLLFLFLERGSIVAGCPGGLEERMMKHVHGPRRPIIVSLIMPWAHDSPGLAYVRPTRTRARGVADTTSKSAFH